MSFKLRHYQQAACDAALDWMRKSIDPCLIDAAPAAGKSFMIAYIANELNAISGKRVLCLAPSAELVKQNHEKFLMTGEKASIFSASAGAKSTRHIVVFGTPGTVKNSIGRFKNDYCAVIVDEAHGITPTIKSIIEAMRLGNPNLRVLGLSGTPFRLGGGYIFNYWPDGRANNEETTRNPYFLKCVYRVSAREMLDEKFITPMVIGEINADRYDTSGIELLPNGTLNQGTVERAFVGHGRKTAAIVSDAMHQATNRKGGVMYFASTVRHAEEVLASLPPETSALVTGETANRKEIIDAYRTGKVRHLVSVGTLTTGFDVSHTETIVLLRYTESASLLQQIMGRAWRLHDSKMDCLLLDYADNIERHFPDGDIYNPDIRAGSAGGKGVPIKATCPDCGHDNEFRINPDYVDYKIDEHGYCLDVFGDPVMTDYGPLSAHFGRRCLGMVKGQERGKYERCNYRWSGKDCPQCGEINDIAARYCYVCKSELVDPNDKLVADFKALKRDPTRPQTDKVIAMTLKEGISQNGNTTLRVDWKTTHRQFSTWFLPKSESKRAKADYFKFMDCTNNGTTTPETLSYVKDSASGFFRILGYNMPEDMEPEASTKHVRARELVS